MLGLRDEVERRGSRFAVVVINTREEVDRDKPNRPLVSFLRRRGIPTIELLPAFRERFPEGTPGFFAWNLHWAPPGHAFAAERIADAIETQGLLDGHCPPCAGRPPSGRYGPLWHSSRTRSGTPSPG